MYYLRENRLSYMNYPHIHVTEWGCDLCTWSLHWRPVVSQLSLQRLGYRSYLHNASSQLIGIQVIFTMTASGRGAQARLSKMTIKGWDIQAIFSKITIKGWGSQLIFGKMTIKGWGLQVSFRIIKWSKAGVFKLSFLKWLSEAGWTKLSFFYTNQSLQSRRMYCTVYI